MVPKWAAQRAVPKGAYWALMRAVPKVYHSAALKAETAKHWESRRAAPMEPRMDVSLAAQMAVKRAGHLVLNWVQHSAQNSDSRSAARATRSATPQAH